MSSIQAYKAHKQEGTIAATTLVSKMHKQGGIFEFPSIPTSVAALHVKKPSSFLPICCYLAYPTIIMHVKQPSIFQFVGTLN